MNPSADCLKTAKRDWCYRWTPTLGRMVHEGVKGPLTQPMLAVPFPCTYEDDSDKCNCEEDVKNSYCRRGIPDPWKEYVVVKKETEKGCLSPHQFPKKDLKITGYLGQNYHLDFGQGIPDPWKKCVSLKRMKGDREDLKRDFRNYFEKMKAEMYETDRICCPNCNRQLLVFCLNEFGRRRRRKQREVREEPMHEVEVEKPTEQAPVDDKFEETAYEERIPLKDACVETDYMKEVEGCICKERKSCECESVRRVSKSKICRCRKDEDSSDSGCFCTDGRNPRHRHVHPPICVHNFLSFLPRLPPNQQWNSSQGSPNNEAQPLPRRDQHEYQPYALPYAPQNMTQPETYAWLPPGYLACSDRNGHFLELKWICQKCEKGKKKRRKDKHRPADVTPLRREWRPCLCKETHSPLLDDEEDSDSCGIYKISRVRNPKPQNNRSSDRTRCHCDKGTSKPNGNPDRDFIQLLQMLGCTDLYRNKRNTDYNEPTVNLNMVSDPCTSERVTHASVPLPSSPNPNFSHWKHPPDTQTDSIRHETYTNRKNTFDNVTPARKSVTFGNSKATVKTTYHSNSTANKLRNVNKIVRRRNRGLFKKELNYFMAKCDTNWLDSDDSTEIEQKKPSNGEKQSNVFGNSSRHDDD